MCKDLGAGCFGKGDWHVPRSCGGIRGVVCWRKEKAGLWGECQGPDPKHLGRTCPHEELEGFLRQL